MHTPTLPIIAVLITAAFTATPTLAAATTAPANFDASHGYSFTELADAAAGLPAWDNPAPHDWQTTSPTGGTGRTGWFGEAWSVTSAGRWRCSLGDRWRLAVPSMRRPPLTGGVLLAVFGGTSRQTVLG